MGKKQKKKKNKNTPNSKQTQNPNQNNQAKVSDEKFFFTNKDSICRFSHEKG